MTTLRSGRRRPADRRTGRLYRIISQSRPLREPPAPLRRAKLDNLALIPASLLPFKEQWQGIANELPEGATLIIVPSGDSPHRKTLHDVAGLMQANGRQVIVLPAEQFTHSLDSTQVEA